MADRHKILVPAFLGIAAGMLAQTPTLQVGGVYECPAVQSAMKVISCAGPGAGDLCEIQVMTGGQLKGGKLPRQQVTGMLQVCHLQTPAEAQAAARGGARPAAAAPQQTGAGGFKVGDSVQALTGFGWMNSKVLQIKGNSYLVHTEAGPDVWKDYPAEIRRVGNLTAADHAAGQYTLKDKVQVNVQGQWLEGQVIGTLNDEYQVSLPGNRTAWAKPQNLRPSTAAPPAPPKSGVAPKPGYVSCAGKIEGRYSSSSGLASFTVTFRAGKATVGGGITGGSDELECWISGSKILLHSPADPDVDMPLDVNNDGTLDTPLGEIRKKGN